VTVCDGIDEPIHLTDESINLTVDFAESRSEVKHLREFRAGFLFIDLYEPFRRPVGAEFPCFAFPANDKNVEIRWARPRVTTSVVKSSNVAMNCP
jgi:hypothetical protein